MRADRLISILMLLQTKGRLTAHQIADEMEVSERTIYRDIDALCTAGVPIYTECGPGGGYELIDSYRTDLMGLNEKEIRALLILSVPQPLRELGLAQEIKGALLKLTAAMSEVDRDIGWHRSHRIHLDSTPWSDTYENVPYLKILHQAIRQNQLISLTYRGAFDTEIKTTAAPYGIVAKTSRWYLVFECSHRMRVIRVSDILDVILQEERFDLPADFSLPLFWENWCKSTEDLMPAYIVTLRVSPNLFDLIRYQDKNIKIELKSIESRDDPDGWKTINIGFESFEDARRNILGYGRAAEVLDPTPLRKSVIDFACQIKDLYQE